MTDLIDQDFGDRDIEINNDPPAVNNKNISSDNRNSNASSSSSKEYEKKIQAVYPEMEVWIKP